MPIELEPESVDRVADPEQSSQQHVAQPEPENSSESAEGDAEAAAEAEEIGVVEEVGSGSVLEQNKDESVLAEERQAPVEYGTELTAEEAAEALDADQVHQEPDAEDGGDYTDYAGTEDDDEEFGEALPEDAGGPSELDDSQHEILPNIYAAPSTDIGEQEASEAETTGSLAVNATTTESMCTSLLCRRSYLIIHCSSATDPPERNPTEIGGGVGADRTGEWHSS